MGLLKKLNLTSKLGEGLGEAAKSLGDVAKEATVDKDKVLAIKGDIEKLKLDNDQAARDMYAVEMEELKGPAINFIRAMVRPLWGIIGALAFGFECFTIIYNWLIHLKRFEGDEIEILQYPQAVHAILMIIAGFYFGSRLLEKRQKNKLNEKWGL